MRRQLASFSSKESMFVMDRRWARCVGFTTRFLRNSDGAFTGPTKRRFQGISEGRPHVRGEESADRDALAVAPERQLAPMIGRIIHLHPHPIRVEANFI